MQQYRLLRNNKESGPYTWKELAHLPLKPYDLVWLDGKSAAWRYPSELPEFKDIAPHIEEDFYEQFHRKPVEKKDTAASSSVKSEKVDNTTTPVTSEVLKKVSSDPQRKKVAVILPEPAMPLNQEPVLRVIKKEVTSSSTEPAADRITDLTLPEPLTDQLQLPPFKKARRTFTFRPMYLALALVGLVVITWLLFQKANLYNATTETAVPSSQLPVIQTENPVEASSALTPALPPNPALEFAALKRFLSVSPDQINVGMFGGINHLLLTVTNKHNQPIEDITLAVDFLEKDQSLHHTEIIELNILEAQSSQSVRVPTNGQGRAVQTRIIGIGKYKP